MAQNYNFFWIYAKKILFLHRFSQKGETKSKMKLY